MKFRSLTKRYIVFLLSFLMAFEPFAVNMVRANDQVDIAPTPEVETMNLDGIDGIIDLDEVQKPVDYLEYTLSLRGRSRGDDPDTANDIDEAVTWGEWMNIISGAYAEMDDGCTDVFSFYNALGEVTGELRNAPDYLEMLCFASNKAVMSAAFVAKHIPGFKAVTSRASKALSSANKWIKSKTNLFNGMDKMGKAFSKACNTTHTFISHMCPPVGFKAGCETGEGFVSYWRWVARKTGMDGNQKYKNAMKKVNEHLSKDNQICTNKGAKVISDTKGIAHTIGIGLTIISIAMDSYDIATSDDTHGGRHFSYSLVKSYMSLALGVGSLVAMFCVPVVGQVLGVVAIVWMCLTAVFDEMGDYNKKWKEAYKNSYWFLYTQDPEFKSYYDNRQDLNEEEKSAAYLVTEHNYGEDYKQNAYDFLKSHQGDNSYYDDKSQEAISARVYIELEKQGVLTSYYNRSEFKLPDYSMNRLLELWEMKADYMSWKPTEEESVRAENRGFWGKVGHALNPMTYVSWVGDKIQSHEYNKIDKYNIEKVFFCPDYVLLKKYITWVTANKKLDGGPNDSFFRTVGLRIEQSPFNYIPLVGIDTINWNNDLLCQAFNADAFFVGVKELMYIKEVIKKSSEEIEKKTKDSNKLVIEYKRSLEQFRKRQKALNQICNAYRDYPDTESEGKKLHKDVKKVMDWKSWNEKENGKQTPRNIVKYHWADINQALTYDSLSVSQKGADLTLLIDSIKHSKDTGKMMMCLYDEKMAALQTFDDEFQNLDFNEYLKKGSFLNVKGSTFMDWLSELYPAYSEMEKYAKLYKEEADKYNEAAEESDVGHKRLWGFLWMVEDEEYKPDNVLKEVNDVIDAYKNTLADYERNERLGEDGLELALSSSDDKIFTDYSIREIKVVDVDKDVSTVVIPE